MTIAAPVHLEVLPPTRQGPVAVGTVLAAERRRRGLTLAQMAAETCIRVPQLQAVEDGTIGAQVAPVYARGYLRAYAAALGVELETGGASDGGPAAVGPAERAAWVGGPGAAVGGLERSRSAPRLPLPSWLVVTRPALAAVGGALLVLLFAAYAVYEFRSAHDILDPAPPARVAQAAPIASPMPLPSGAESAAAAAAGPIPGQTGARPVVAAAQTRVSVRATEHVWVSVIVDGKVNGGFMDPGDERAYTGHSVEIQAGKPTLEVSVDGGAFTSMGALNREYIGTPH